MPGQPHLPRSWPAFRSVHPGIGRHLRTFTPELFHALKGYTRRQALTDVGSGVIVGIVALPLAIAFAIASGLSPEYGLYTAIVAGFLISALGGSRVQIGGPTGAFVVIVYAIVQEHGIDGLQVATMMAGVILIILGFAKLGTAIKFIPFPVTTGFTSGIAVVILSGQVGDLLGLRTGPMPAEFIEKWATYAEHLHTVDPWAAAIAAVSLFVLVSWPRASRTVPAPFVALVVGTVAVQAFGLEVETIGSRFGGIEISLPAPRLPAVGLAEVRELVGPAFAIALLGAIESLLSAVVADGMIGSRHRSNTELLAQGVANVAAPLFGGMPATGAIARTATNVRNGGRTPVAGITHAVTLLLITMFFGRWAAAIPLATLAAILVVVAYHMSDWRTFKAELAGPRSDVAVMLMTFTLTVVIDLVVALEAGMVLAAFLFMRRMAEVTDVSVVTDEFLSDVQDEAGMALRRGLPKSVAVYEINGPFFFGAAEKFKETLGAVSDPPRVLVLRMANVTVIDATALNALKDLIRRTRSDGTLVLLSEVRAQPLAVMARSHLMDEIGEENIHPRIEDALRAAREYVESAALFSPVATP
jgi:SulP family sulfate permease